MDSNKHWFWEIFTLNVLQKVFSSEIWLVILAFGVKFFISALKLGRQNKTFENVSNLFSGPLCTCVDQQRRTRECRIWGFSRREQSFSKSTSACHCGNWDWSRAHPRFGRITPALLAFYYCSWTAKQLYPQNKPKQLSRWRESSSGLELWLQAFPRPQSDPCHLQIKGGPNMRFWYLKTTVFSLEALAPQAHTLLNPFQLNMQHPSCECQSEHHTPTLASNNCHI